MVAVAIVQPKVPREKLAWVREPARNAAARSNPTADATQVAWSSHSQS